LKLATLPTATNAAAVIYSLVVSEAIQAWASPAMLDEYLDVLSDEPLVIAEVSEFLSICHPLTELSIIKHEPDNRFLECALLAGVDYLITVNTARGHFDQSNYDGVKIVTPGALLRLPAVQKLLS
jgi:predicted nucleic acid-binding protein